MSAIFGLTSNLTECNICDSMKELNHWNETYGTEAVRLEIFGDSGLGCRIEHFSESFPFGGPLLEFDGQYAAVDALLYNRDELLPLLGLDADSKISDEELLLRLVREKGFDTLAQVNGDFAGAIFNPRKKEWTIFRDHMGVRPLFYHIRDDFFAFSTDIRGLVALLDERARPSEEQQYRLMSGYRRITLCETDYAEIFCIHPGSYTVVKAEKSSFLKQEYLYWQIHQTNPHFEKDWQYGQELRRLIMDSVKRRADAIPGVLGAELSGGLDSGVISILLSRLGRETVHYSWSKSTEELPMQEGLDERGIIQDICEQEHFTCDFYTPSQRYTVQQYLDMVLPAHTDTYHLSYGSKVLRSKGTRVMFTGHGGDEGVSHRCSTYEMLCYGEWKHYLKYHWHYYKGSKHRLWKTIFYSVGNAIYQHREYKKDFCSSDLASFVLKDSFRMKMKRIVKPGQVYFNGRPDKYINHGGTRWRLDNAAFQGALCGVRYLFPYVDYRVIDYAVSIPRYLFLWPGIDRTIFREAFRDIIPESLYKMRFKDIPSLRGRDYSEERLMELCEIYELIPLLDQKYWGEILDFAEINNLHFPTVNDKVPTSSKSEVPPELKYSLAVDKLLTCLLIQNVRDKAREWREAHE